MDVPYPPDVPSRIGGRRLLLAAVTVTTLSAFPATVLAHAELTRAIPADGSIVTEPVTFVSGRYTEDLAPDSNLRILDAGGNTVATGGVDPDDDRVMIARPASPLSDGTYTVRSTAISSVDGHPERQTWTFTVAIAATPAPPPSPTAGTSAPATSSPTQEVTPSAAPSASPTPTASPDPGSPTGSTTDVLLPIIVALALVLVLGGFLLSRSRAGR